MGTQGDNALAWLRDYSTAVKHGSIKPFTATERKARAATRNQPWGPTGTELGRLAALSYNATDCAIILQVVDLRLAYPPKKWRNVYKGLTLLEYLLRHGSEACVERARGGLIPTLESLAAGFHFIGPDGRDSGVNVRHRAQAIVTLLKDGPRLAEEREAHTKKRGAYQGFSSYDVMAQGGPPRPSQDAYQAAANDGGHLSKQGSGTAFGGEQQQPSSPDYRERGATDAQLRNAGETKGVSMEENRLYLAALKRLLELPANRACADCGGSGSGARPGWASISCGVFICMRCAGVHRGIGVHVSKVRSCTLDTWLPDQVEFMARTGNALANAYWEAKLGQGQGGKPSQLTSLPELEAFVRRKYAGKEYAAGTWPPLQLADGPEVSAILADCLPAHHASQLPGNGPQSAAGEAEEAAAAAALLAEQRRAAAVASAAAAASVNLMDFDMAWPEPAAAAAAPAVVPVDGQGSTRLDIGAADPMRSLEGVFGAAAAAGDASWSSTQQPHQAGRTKQALNGLLPSAPADSMGSWDMGAALAARQHEAAAAAAAQAAAALPAKPPPYCPPWAPQPHAAAGDPHANMQIVPAGLASGFHSYGGGGSAASYAGVQPSQQGGNPFSATASSYYASHQPRSIASPTQQKPQAQQAQQARPSPRLPASPAEEKAEELISRDLFAFNLHAETVSALGPSRLTAQHQQAAAAPPVPLIAMRSPR
ncbi:hypothetical protein D9Q98_008696 [Chlorella vulgaris]|uniref:Uncharacterized protein n=1 Tax=Chlorella vulgaris TaxID=3077 RepID=A0A9D4TII1_CHLVU|nr:hypothetical protein D9Q98_008696 [Chlorella vulgaris]